MASEEILDRNIRFSYSPQVKTNQIYLFAAVSLTLLDVMQAMLNMRWEWLYALQNDVVYKQVSGFLLFIYVFMQGRLGFQRLRYPSSSLRKLFYYHKVQGVFGPFLFYLHSVEVGFAYQVVLTSVFLLNCVFGYLSPQTIKIRNKIYTLCWTVLHISLAIMTFVLMCFHIFVVYYYS